MDNRAAGTVQCLVGEDLSDEVVILPIHSRKEPHRLERDYLLHSHLSVNLARQLGHIFEPSLAEELENLAIPFVIFERVNTVVIRQNRFSEHSVGQTHRTDYRHFTPGLLNRIQARLCQNDGLSTVGVDIAGDDADRDAIVRI